jgi:hypothetical protein
MLDAASYPRELNMQTGLPALLHPPERLPACAVASSPFVRFTVTGLARKFHPASLVFSHRDLSHLHVTIYLSPSLYALRRFQSTMNVLCFP